MTPGHGPAFLKRITVVPDRVPISAEFPYRLLFVRDLDLPVDRAVTYFVGENGSGKSTLVAKTRVKIGAADIGTGTLTTCVIDATRTFREKDACALSGGR